MTIYSNDESIVWLYFIYDPGTGVDPAVNTYEPTMEINEPTIYTLECRDLENDVIIGTTVINVLPVFEEF